MSNQSTIDMTSTDIKIGLTSANRPSSRVLKPPGGGHSNIFAEPDVAVIAPRPKYNQQNSSNLNACMNSTDPNKKVVQLREEVTHAKETPTNDGKANGGGKATTTNGGGATNGTNDSSSGASSRGRVPPGGFSSGSFW